MSQALGCVFDAAPHVGSIHGCKVADWQNNVGRARAEVANEVHLYMDGRDARRYTYLQFHPVGSAQSKARVTAFFQKR